MMLGLSQNVVIQLLKFFNQLSPILSPWLGLCPDWEDWQPKDRLKNAKEAMDLAQDWLGVPQVCIYIILFLQGGSEILWDPQQNLFIFTKILLDVSVKFWPIPSHVWQLWDVGILWWVKNAQEAMEPSLVLVWYSLHRSVLIQMFRHMARNSESFLTKILFIRKSIRIQVDSYINKSKCKKIWRHYKASFCNFPVLLRHNGIMGYRQNCCFAKTLPWMKMVFFSLKGCLWLWVVVRIAKPTLPIVIPNLRAMCTMCKPTISLFGVKSIK